jgi:hypothetical protein
VLQRRVYQESSASIASGDARLQARYPPSGFG